MLNEFKKWFKEIEPICKNNTSRAMNQEIKNKFRNEMFKYKNDTGNQIYYSRPSHAANTGEWLYDFISRKMITTNNIKFMSEMTIAMEIELSYDKETDNKYDFNKLLQSDSLYKIFVFQKKTVGDANTAFSQLITACNIYNFRCDSEFLFCCWVSIGNSFEFARFNAKCKS